MSLSPISFSHTQFSLSFLNFFKSQDEERSWSILNSNRLPFIPNLKSFSVPVSFPFNTSLLFLTRIFSSPKHRKQANSNIIQYNSRLLHWIYCLKVLLLASASINMTYYHRTKDRTWRTKNIIPLLHPAWTGPRWRTEELFSKPQQVRKNYKLSWELDSVENFALYLLVFLAKPRKVPDTNAEGNDRRIRTEGDKAALQMNVETIE